MPTPPLPDPLADLISGTDDADLLVRLRRKDPNAIGLLYDRYGKTAYSLAFRILGHPQAAESVVAESVLKCWNRITSFRQARGSALGAWLLLTTYVTTMDHLKGHGLNNADDWSAQPSPLEQGPLFHGWSKELDGDYLQALYSALQKLDSEEKRALDLAFFKGLTPAEITTTLAISHADFDHLIASALAKLSASE
jgi:RNA polymerase sigma-70 factor (ECF subfamily)